MAHSDTTGAFKKAMVSELLAAQRDLNAAHERQAEWLRLHPLPPLTRSQWMRRKVSWWQHDVRTRIARFVAPWLDDY